MNREGPWKGGQLRPPSPGYKSQSTRSFIRSNGDHLSLSTLSFTFASIRYCFIVRVRIRIRHCKVDAAFGSPTPKLRLSATVRNQRVQGDLICALGGRGILFWSNWVPPTLNASIREDARGSRVARGLLVRVNRTG